MIKAISRRMLFRGILLLGLCGLRSAVALGSTLVSHSAGPALIRETIVVGFVGSHSESALDWAEDNQQAPPMTPAPGAVASVTASATKIPASGSGKDIATGSITTQLTYGTGDTDAFELSGSVTLSALTALNTAGNPAAAEVQAGGAVTFFLKTGGLHPITGLPTVAGDWVGHLVLAAPGPLALYEMARNVSVVEDPGPTQTVLANLSAGDPGTAVNLHAGSSYRVNFDYSARVPYGIDPTFDFSLTAGSTVVPEPSVLVTLIGLGAMGLFALARRRHSAA